PEGHYIPPPESAFLPFEVIAKSEEQVSPIETKLHFRLAAYRLPDDLEIPPLQVRYRNEASEIEVLTTKAIPVEVVTSLTSDVTDIHDIKDPVDLEVPRDLSLLWWLLAALLAAILAYLIYRKLRKEPESLRAPQWLPPLPPPDVEAETALERLASKDLIPKGEFAAFYTELSEIMKRYAGRRFEVPYLERTTYEVLGDLRQKKLATDVLTELRAILDASDMVKFAKLLPESSQAEKSFQLAHNWLEKTRPAPVIAERKPEEAIA
ncbi:MAG: hypothetical protein ACRD21_26375, partial [Vicinamibacteria bacterium]